MRIFLAGGISGNLNPFWRLTAENKIEDAMKIFLAGQNGKIRMLRERSMEGDSLDIAVLESFFYCETDGYIQRLIPRFSDFLLDSGAFTFMMGNHGKPIIWEEYTDKFADFICRNKIDKFFELDIDSLVGYDQVKALRKRLERATGKKPIPVWHKSRGKNEFLNMADNYPYVALGGIVSKEWSKEEHKYFPWFISEAHKRGAKIHGLGYTQLEGLKKYHFDSVDSTAWTTGNRFGFIYEFTGATMIKHDVPKGHRLADPRAVALINFTEWIKFQKYAEVHL